LHGVDPKFVIFHRVEMILVSFMRQHMICAAAFILSAAVTSAQSADPQPPGKLVDLGGHRLHVNCSGHGAPTVVVENGLGDFSFDWILVQARVAHFTRICTYDRAGYAWSDPGPMPRTFAQVNLELHDALQKLGEKGPFVLVGHSYGGPVVRSYAAAYPAEVAGIVLVDAAHEGLRVQVGPKQTIRLGADVQAREIPAPREAMNPSDKPGEVPPGPGHPMALESIYHNLPPFEQKLHIWAQKQASVEIAEDSQRQWSDQTFAAWLADPGKASLGPVPLIVLTRAKSGYTQDLDVSAAQMEQERKEGQARLVSLSSDSEQIMVNSGHNMHLEAPSDVEAAIRRMVEAVRSGKALLDTPRKAPAEVAPAPARNPRQNVTSVLISAG
jgi:pimeloyl-ACP methyl ester carboxylesterase